jgi:single-strand DNA-binding protein
MNSFKLIAVGNLARNPDLVAKGDTLYTRFCLIGNDYAGQDEEGGSREVITSLWFTAFGGLGEAIAKNALKGDQLIVEARVRADNWTDKQGEKQYDHSFIVESFRFGAPGPAKREQFEAQRGRVRELPEEG